MLQRSTHVVIGQHAGAHDALGFGLREQVDEAKISDPDAKKPEDWDENAPAAIPDMDATMVSRLMA